MRQGKVGPPAPDPRIAWHYLYTSERYQRARAEFLHRNPLCCMCKRPKPSTTLDHVVPHKGNVDLFWDEGNWQALCDHHHNSVKQMQERSRATPKGSDGWPVGGEEGGGS